MSRVIAFSNYSTLTCTRIFRRTENAFLLYTTPCNNDVYLRIKLRSFL